MPNLVKLFTVDGSVHIDTAQLARQKRHLTIYTAHGNLLSEFGRTKEIRESASWGIHFENLFASRDLAEARSNEIWRELFGANALTEKQLRERGC